MLIIKTKLKEAGHKGIGVFAEEAVKKGELVYIFEPDFCKSFKLADIAKVSKNVTKLLPKKHSRSLLFKISALKYKFLKEYATREDKLYWLDLDNTRFINHDKKPNIKFVKGLKAIAIADIKIGDEITCDYVHLSKYNKDLLFIKYPPKAKKQQNDKIRR